MQGGKQNLKIWSGSRVQEWAWLHSSVVCLHIFIILICNIDDQGLISAHASSCPSPDLRSWKMLGFFFLLLFSLSAMSKMPHVNASLFSQVKKSKNKKTSIGIRAGHCLQQRPGLRDIVLPVGNKSGEGEWFLISGFSYAGAPSF